MKILNLYAGIGGNRKLWSEGHETTAVEYNAEIAEVYKKFFPNDTVIVGDAHEYLLNNFEQFDFIWTSPPCPTHSRVRKMLAWKTKKDGTKYRQNDPVYPDMRLYQEILLLDNYFEGYFVVENVVSFYEPLVTPQKIGKHYIWANFKISDFVEKTRGHDSTVEELEKIKGFDLSGIKINKRLVLRNAVNTEMGLHIFNEMMKAKSTSDNSECAVPHPADASPKVTS